MHETHKTAIHNKTHQLNAPASLEAKKFLIFALKQIEMFLFYVLFMI